MVLGIEKSAAKHVSKKEKKDKSKAFLVTSKAARDRCQALSPVVSNQARSGPTQDSLARPASLFQYTKWERRGATYGMKGRHFTFDRAGKEHFGSSDSWLRMRRK